MEIKSHAPEVEWLQIRARSYAENKSGTTVLQSSIRPIQRENGKNNSGLSCLPSVILRTVAREITVSCSNQVRTTYLPQTFQFRCAATDTSRQSFLDLNDWN